MTYKKRGRMLNENLIAVAICLLAIVVTLLGYDDGSYIKMVISAYLGWLLGRNQNDQDKRASR